MRDALMKRNEMEGEKNCKRIQEEWKGGQRGKEERKGRLIF